MNETDHPNERNEPPAGAGDDLSVPRELQDLVVELRALPRWVAPSGPGAALTFVAVMERVEESRLDARLEAEAPAIRRLLQDLRDHGRLRAPASLTLPGTIPSSGPRLRVLRREPARMAAFVAAAAAAALMAATLLPAVADVDATGTSGARLGKTGLAAQTAALTGRPTLAVEIRYVDPRPGGR